MPRFWTVFKNVLKSPVPWTSTITELPDVMMPANWDATAAPLPPLFWNAWYTPISSAPALAIGPFLTSETLVVVARQIGVASSRVRCSR